MFRINISNGKTVIFDPFDETQAKQMLTLLKNREFQKNITGITVLRRYSRQNRCPSCKHVANLVCPICGEINGSNILKYTGAQYTLLKPDCNDFSYSVDIIGQDRKNAGVERLICHIGDTQLSMTTYAKQPATRVALRKLGKQRYNPNVE